MLVYNKQRHDGRQQATSWW